MEVCLGYREVQHIRRLNVRHLLEHGHQLRQIEEPCKPGLGSVTGALRGQFDGRHGLPKGGRPGVKVDEAVLTQRIILEILLHGVHLHHRI